MTIPYDNARLRLNALERGEYNENAPVSLGFLQDKWGMAFFNLDLQTLQHIEDGLFSLQDDQLTYYNLLIKELRKLEADTGDAGTLKLIRDEIAALREETQASIDGASMALGQQMNFLYHKQVVADVGRDYEFRHRLIGLQDGINAIVADVHRITLGLGDGDGGADPELLQNIFGGVEAIATELAQNPPATIEEVTATLDDRLAKLVEKLPTIIAGGGGDLAAEVNAIATALRDLDQQQLPLLTQRLLEIINFAVGSYNASVTTASAGFDKVKGSVDAVASAVGEGGAGALIPSVTGLSQSYLDAVDRHFAKQAVELRKMGMDPDTLDEQLTLSMVPGLKNIGALVGKFPALWHAIPEVIKYALGFELASFAIDQFPLVQTLVEKGGEKMGATLMHGIEFLHKPMVKVLEGGATLVFEELENTLDAMGEATPENAQAMAAKMLALAGGFGMSAHMAAIIAEKNHRAKHLGLPQLAAFLADLAAFGEIARDSLGENMKAAIAVPSRRGALSRFRPELPDPFSFMEMFFAREISEQEFGRYYAEHGWNEDFIDAHLTSVFRKASPREMAMVLEDGPADPAWIVRMLQRVGFNDDDSQRLSRGVIARALKSARAEMISGLTANYVDGLVVDDQLRAGLADVPLDPAAVDLHMQTAQLKRARSEADKLRTALLTGAAAGAFDLATLNTQLALLGYDERARGVLVQVAQLRLGVANFRKESAHVEAEIRKQQSVTIEAAMGAFERELIDAAELGATLIEAGVDPAAADAYVALAEVRRTPIPKLAEVFTEERQAQLDLEEFKKTVAILIERGAMDGGQALNALVAAGVARREATLDVQLAQARIAPKPDVARPPTKTQQARAADQAGRDAAIEKFRDGLIGADSLRAALKASELNAAAVDSIVAREVARLTRERTKTLKTTADKTIAETNTQLRAEAIEFYRVGKIDDGELVIRLVAAGEPALAALAMADKEKAAKEAKAPKPAATAPTGS